MEDRGGEGPGGAAIAGQVVAALRFLLREQDRWAAVAARLEAAHAGHIAYFEAPELPAFIPLTEYFPFLDAVQAVVGDAGLVQLGRDRVAGDLEAGYFGGILRGWLRTVGTEPKELLRVVEYLWKGAIRDAGEVRLVQSGDAFLHYELHDVPILVVGARHWHRVLQGIVEGVLLAAKLSGDVRFEPDASRADVIELLIRWQPA